MTPEIIVCGSCGEQVKVWPGERPALLLMRRVVRLRRGAAARRPRPLPHPPAPDRERVLTPAPSSPEADAPSGRAQGTNKTDSVADSRHSQVRPVDDVVDCVGAKMVYRWRGHEYEAIVNQDDGGFYGYTVSRLVDGGDEVHPMDVLASQPTAIEVHSTEAVFFGMDEALTDALEAILAYGTVEED